jgi:hypothetical protein
LGLRAEVLDNGTVSYDPSLEGVFHGAGTNTLVVHGVTLNIDASALSGNFLAVNYAEYDSNTPFSINLLPGSNELWDRADSMITFNVALDGTVNYDPSLQGILTLRRQQHSGGAGESTSRSTPPPWGCG